MERVADGHTVQPAGLFSSHSFHRGEVNAINKLSPGQPLSSLLALFVSVNIQPKRNGSVSLRRRAEALLALGSEGPLPSSLGHVGACVVQLPALPFLLQLLIWLHHLPTQS